MNGIVHRLRKTVKGLLFDGRFSNLSLQELAEMEEDIVEDVETYIEEVEALAKCLPQAGKELLDQIKATDLEPLNAQLESLQTQLTPLSKKINTLTKEINQIEGIIDALTNLNHRTQKGLFRLSHFMKELNPDYKEKDIY